MDQVAFGAAMFVIGSIIGIVLARMVKPIAPKDQVFTWRGLLIGAILLVLLAAVWPMILVSRGEGIGAELAKLVLANLQFSVAIAALVAVACWYKMYLFNNRLEVIEKHVGLSKAQ